MTSRFKALLVACISLTLVSLFAFWPVLGNGFVDYDDPLYVTANPHVQQGLSASSLAWAFRSTFAGNWHPLTWISHMLDWRLYGPDPRGHHVTSLLLHAATAILLFLALERATSCLLRSAFVAALFAVHPLHVESVAWIAERKDVLSALFWMLAIWGYVRWVEAPGVRRYVVVLAAQALGLAAKPMLVTLPFTLLLLDAWPLARMGALVTLWSRVREKIPLFALSLLSCVVTLYAQRQDRAVATLKVFHPGDRISNAVVSCVAYLLKTVWPSGLSFFYPHPRQGLPAGHVAGSALVLAVVTIAVVRARARRPYLLVGWLFYLGTLVPVIGLVQVGSQGMADRYTYVPLVGIFVMAAWGIPDLATSLRGKGATADPRWLALPGAALLLALALATRVEAGYWRDSATLYGRALEVSADNYLAHYGMGVLRTREGKVEEAIRHYETSARLRPDYALTHNNLARLLAGQGRLDEAHLHALAALRHDPNLADAHDNLGIVLGMQGLTQQAIQEYELALRIDPGDPPTHNNLGNALARQGRMEEAVREFRSAIVLKPDYGVAHANLGAALFALGRYEEAWKEVHRARQLRFDVPAELVESLSARMPEPAAP